MSEHLKSGRLNYRSSEMCEQTAVVTTASTAGTRSTQEAQPIFGKASSVASQNLSIIVEAINHLEGDGHRQAPASDKVS